MLFSFPVLEKRIPFKNVWCHAVENVRRGNWGEVGEDVGQIQYAVVEAVVGTKGAGLALKGLKTGAQVGLMTAKGLIGAERLAQIAAKSAQVLNRIKFGASGIVRIGQKSTVYRVQGGLPPNASWRRVTVSKNGSINIEGEQMLYVNIDDLEHAVYFYNKRGGVAGGAEIVKFKIPRRLAEQIKREAVPQDMGRRHPTKPQISDPTKSPSAYGLPKEWIERLNREAIKGSGEVITP